jgi:hypothetical protein
MTSYCSIPECRMLTGLTTTDIGNDDLQALLNYSSTIIVNELLIRVSNEELQGKIDGSNTLFKLAKFPIADISGNASVGSEDVAVYSWTDSVNPSSKSTISVSTVYAKDGYITLSTAPNSTVKKLTVDYAYTYEEALSWDLIKVACAYMSAYMFAIKKFTVIPDTVSRGPLRFSYKTKPYNEYLKKYDEIMGMIRTKIHSVKRSQDMQLERKRMVYF